jgi:SAM-dependent methyltransferase
MITSLKTWLRRQAFDPGPAGMLVNPFFLARRGLMRAMRKFAGRVSGRLLDVGCGQKPYRDVFDVSSYIGVEIDSPANRKSKRADYFYDGRHLPFADHEFDAVLCNQVLEHVFEPEEFVAELLRVLKPGGILLLTVPFVWDEHEQPFDYARYSSFGLRHLLAKHGFVVDEHHKTLADASVLCQLWNAYIFKITQTRFRILNLLFTALLMAPVSLAGVVLSPLLPRNADLYLDNIVVAHRRSESAN